jgi:hypothetical protein
LAPFLLFGDFQSINDSSSGGSGSGGGGGLVQADLAGGGGKADIHAASWTLGDKTLVLAVNATNQPVHCARIGVPVRVALGGGGGGGGTAEGAEEIKPVVKALFEDRTCLSVQVDGGTGNGSMLPAQTVVITEPLLAFGTAAYMITFDGAICGPEERTRLPEALPCLCLGPEVDDASQGRLLSVPTRNLQLNSLFEEWSQACVVPNAYCEDTSRGGTYSSSFNTANALVKNGILPVNKVFSARSKSKRIYKCGYFKGPRALSDDDYDALCRAWLPPPTTVIVSQGRDELHLPSN